MDEMRWMLRVQSGREQTRVDDYFETSQSVRMSKYHAWAWAGNGGWFESDSACFLSLQSACGASKQANPALWRYIRELVCMFLCVWLVLRVKRSEIMSEREDILILVNLRLIPLCPLSSCHVPNSFMDGLAPLRLIAMSDSCPGLAYRQELWSWAQSPERARTGADLQGQSLNPHLGRNYLCSWMGVALSRRG